MLNRIKDFLTGSKEKMSPKDLLIKVTSVADSLDNNEDMYMPLTLQQSSREIPHFKKNPSVEEIMISLRRCASELSDFNLGFLEYCHPLMKLCKEAPITLQKELIKYHKLNFILDMINKVSKKLKIIRKENYEWLFDGGIAKIRMIDLDSIFEKAINMEVLWMSVVVLNGPLKTIASEELKSLARLLLQEFTNLLLTLKISKNSLAEETYFIVGAKNSEMKNKQGGILGYLKKCFGKSTEALSDDIYQSLKDFEYVYRYFEESLLKTCMSFENRLA